MPLQAADGRQADLRRTAGSHFEHGAHGLGFVAIGQGKHELNLQLHACAAQLGYQGVGHFPARQLARRAQGDIAQTLVGRAELLDQQRRPAAPRARMAPRTASSRRCLGTFDRRTRSYSRTASL